MAKNPLPPLEPYKTSPAARNNAHVRARPGDATPEPPPTAAVAPTIKAKARPKPDPNPYDPVGIGVGSLRLVPFVEASGGYDSNPDRLSSSYNPSGSKFARLDAGLKLRAEDWKRDGLEGDLRLGYVDYSDYAPANRADGAGSVAGHYDVTRDTTIDMGAHFALDSQRPDAPAIASGLSNVTVTNRPIIFSAGGSLGATQKFSRLEVSLRGSFDRTLYGNAHYSDGSTLVLTGTDFNDYGATGRVAYEVSPSLKPFVVPIALAVLIALFMVQRRGTAGIGAVFGPVMVLWFVVVAVSGLLNIGRSPDILEAFNPLLALEFLFNDGWLAFVSLGSVVLALTGAEALYADMGHFGASPIRLS